MAKQKFRSQKGFTLVEMLCTIIVLLLVSALMVTGIRLAAKTLRKSVMDSESYMLCTTLRTLVSDELRYCGTIDTTDADTGVKFFSQNYGENCYFSVNDDGHVVLVDSDGESNKILTSNSYPYGMMATVAINKYDSTTRIFNVTVTVTDSDGGELSSSTFDAKQLNEPAATAG